MTIINSVNNVLKIKSILKTFENFKEQGICDHCLEIKDCIDFEVAYLLDGCKNEFGFYKPREKEFISFLKEKNIPFLRGYKTLGDFIDGKETISLNHVNDKIRNLVLLFQNPIYNLNYDVFKRGYQGGYSLMNQFNNSKEYNSFIKGMNEYVKKSEYVDSVIVKHDELFPYTKEHMKSLLNLKNSLSYNNSTQIIDYIESISEERFNSKYEIELFLYFNIIDLALKHIKNKT